MRISAIVSVLAALAASTTAVRAADTVVIGVIAPFSGDYATYGEGYDRGITIWKEMYGDLKASDETVEIKQIDDMCDVNTGLAAYRREAGNLLAAIGPACSGVVRAVTPLATTDKVPLLFLGHGAGLTMTGAKDGYAFRMTQPDDFIQKIFAKFILDKWKADGKTKIAAIHDTSDAYSNTGNLIKEAVAAAGMEFVADEKFDLGNKDFTAQLLNIKKSGAQAAIIATYEADEGRLLQQLADLNLDLTVAGSGDTPYLALVDTDMVAGNTKSLENVYYYSDFVPGEQATEVAKFNAAYAKKYGKVPLDIDYEGWLAMSILNTALKTPGASEGGDKLRQALQSAKVDLGGREVTFIENGDQATLLTYIGQIKNGAPTLVDLVQSPRTDFPLVNK
jgi:branched-chain amino acid transport system substrate-binding protein